MSDIKSRLQQIIEKLNEASKAYYAEDKEIMSNYEYDALYDELVELEKQSGIILSNSPTVKVGYEAVDYLPKEKHEKPMLSLSKTKSPDELRSWLNGKEALLSWKEDGLTVVLTYDNGELIKGVTRGNGEIGEVITNNVKNFANVPICIDYKGKLVVRGEAIITYSEFEKINMTISDSDAKYKNPRNLCSGSVRQLDPMITKERNVRFIAFSLVIGEEDIFENSVKKQFEFLKQQGFEVVEYKSVNESNILETIEWFSKEIVNNDIPSDGLVLSYDDIEYGKSLGMTAKFPRNAIAFKWKDEIKETILRDIEWSASRTGLINPVALFDTIDLEGTNVSRASLHNVSYVEDLELGIGDRITVYKANMIIPQLAENLTKSGNTVIPKFCPVCNGVTIVRNDNATKMLYCTNDECPAKMIKSFAHFSSRNAMNIEGLSEATLEKFISRGFIKSFADIFKIDRYKMQIIELEGFGEKSYENIIESIDKARSCTMANLICALGIDGIGASNAKVIAKSFSYDLKQLRTASLQMISEVEGIGDVLANGLWNYLHNDSKAKQLDELIEELQIEKVEIDQSTQTLTGKTFVITGSLNNYVNRDELKKVIEDRGGKVAGSVSKNTEALINNDVASNSSKNKKAKELRIPILSEDDFEKKYL